MIKLIIVIDLIYNDELNAFACLRERCTLKHITHYEHVDFRYFKKRFTPGLPRFFVVELLYYIRILLSYAS